MGWSIQNEQIAADAREFYRKLLFNNDTGAVDVLKRAQKHIEQNRGRGAGFFLAQLEDVYTDNGGNLKQLFSQEQQTNVLSALISKELAGSQQSEAINLSLHMLPASALARQLELLQRVENGQTVTIDGIAAKKSATTAVALNKWADAQEVNRVIKNRGLEGRVQASKPKISQPFDHADVSSRPKQVRQLAPVVREPLPMDKLLDETWLFSWVDNAVDQLMIPADMSEAEQEEFRTISRGLIIISLLPAVIYAALRSGNGGNVIVKIGLWIAQVFLFNEAADAANALDQQFEFSQPRLNFKGIVFAAAFLNVITAGKYINADALALLLKSLKSPVEFARQLPGRVAGWVGEFVVEYWKKIKLPETDILFKEVMARLRQGDVSFLTSPLKFLLEQWEKVKSSRANPSEAFLLSLPNLITFVRTVLSFYYFPKLALETLGDPHNLEGENTYKLVLVFAFLCVLDGLDGIAARRGVVWQKAIIKELFRRISLVLQRRGLSPKERYQLNQLRIELEEIGAVLAASKTDVIGFKKVEAILVELQTKYPHVFDVKSNAQGFLYRIMVMLGMYQTPRGALYDAGNDKVIGNMAFFLLISANGFLEGDLLAILLPGIASNQVNRGDDVWKSELRKAIELVFGPKESGDYTPARMSGKIKFAVGLIAIIAFYSDDLLTLIGVDTSNEKTRAYVRNFSYFLMAAMMGLSAYSVRDYANNPKLREAMNKIKDAMLQDPNKKEVFIKLCRIIGMEVPAVLATTVK